MRFIVMFVTAVCVLFLIKLRWPKKKNFYDTSSNPAGLGLTSAIKRRARFPCGITRRQYEVSMVRVS